MIEFNWCLDTQIADLLHHNVFLSGDYEGSWVRPCVASDFDAPKQHNFYCHNPVFTDTTCAPPGGSSIMVLLPVANINEQARMCKKRGLPVPTEEEMVAAGREAILRRFEEAGHGDLRQHIKHESVTTPTQWREKFNIKHGAVFGLSHGLTQLAAFRPPVRTGIARAGFSRVRRASLRGRVDAAGQRRAAGAHGRQGCVRRHHQDARRRGEGHAR